MSPNDPTPNDDPEAIPARRPDHASATDAEPATVAAKRWPAIATLLTSWLMPATTARRTAHVSLGKAYGIHWLVVLLTTGVVFVLGSVAAADYGRGSVLRVLAEVSKLLDEISDDIAQNPSTSIAVIAGIVVGVELLFVVLALLATPLGARDEPMRSSVANALRRTWLQTPHLLPAAVLIGACLIGVSAAVISWRSGNRTPDVRFPDPPSPPTNQPPKSQAWKNYEEALRAHHEETLALWNAYRRGLPWYVDHDEELMTYGCFAVATWFLWALFRSVAARRAGPPIERPPLCEACGYNLTAAPMDGRCSECGQPVAMSLGPDVRPGVAWQRRREIGRWRAGRQCAQDAVFRPTSFGRQIQLTADGSDHRRFLVLHIPLFFLVGAFGVLCFALIDFRGRPFREPEVVYIVAPLLGYISAVLLLIIVLGTTWLVALYYRFADGRNLLNASTQMAVYLSGYLGGCGLISALFAAVMGELRPIFQALRDLTGIAWEALAFLAWSLVTAVWIVGYVSLVHRGTAATRFANR